MVRLPDRRGSASRGVDRAEALAFAAAQLHEQRGPDVITLVCGVDRFDSCMNILALLHLCAVL